MKKITLFTLLLTSSFIGFGQTLLNDFESANADDNVKSAFQILYTIFDNPSKTGINTSDKVIKVLSEDGEHPSFGLIAVDLDPVQTIGTGENKFLSIMVNYPASPSLLVRFDGDSNITGAGEYGTNPGRLRPLNTYDGTNPNTWQEIIFEIKDGFASSDFTLGTINRIVVQVDEIGDVLEETVPGYFDNFRILDENPLLNLSTRDSKLENQISIYPTSVASTFTVNSETSIKDIALFNILGKNVTSNLVELSNSTFDISSLSSGMYIVKITGENGNFATKKIIKE